MNAGRRAADAAIEILVTEDSATQAESLRYLLEQHDYKVVVASDGRQALDWLANHIPAMVITDINMPFLGGYDLCRQIKADKRLRDVPVILLTSLSDTRDVLEGLACGADSFITKPYSEEYLVARVERTLVDAALPHSHRASIRVEIPIPGQSGVITADPQRMVSLLMSSYEAAIFRNTELIHAQDALRALNEHLEDIVEDRTAVLTNEIAERQQAEGKIRYLAGVLENVSDGIISLDLQGKIQSWNSGAEMLFGYPAVTVLGQSYADLVAYDYLDSTEADAFRQIGETGNWRGEVGSHHQNGSLIYVLVAAAVLKDSHGAVTGFSAVLHDVTDRKRAEAAIRLSEARFRALIENSTDAISLIGPDGNLQYGSPSTIRILGFSGEELLGTDPVKLIHPDDLPAVMVMLADLLQHPGQTAATHYRMANKLGVWRWIEASISNLLAEPSVGAIVFNYRDVSERVEAEAHIRFQANLLDRIGQAVIATNMEGQITFWNHHAERLYGWSAAEVIGRSVVDVTPSQMSREQAADIMRLLGAGQTWEGEFVVQHRNGTSFPILVTDSPVYDGQGRITGIVGVSLDISERKKAELDLAQSNELLSQAEEIGRIGSWQWGIGADRVVWSPGMYELLGESPITTDSSFAAYLDRLHVDDRPRVEQLIANSLDTYAPIEYEARILRPNGQVRVLSARTKVFVGAQGQAMRQAGVMIDVTERKQRERELEAISAISMALRSAHTPAQMLPVVLAQVMALLSASAASVAMRDPATNELEIVLGGGEMSELSGLRLPSGTGIGGQVLATGQPYTSANLAVDPYWYQVEWLREIRAAACVPLITSQNVLGVLWAVRVAPFNDAEVRLLSAIADIAATAIQRARLHEQTEQRLHRLTALREIDSAIMNSLDLTATLVVILEQVASQLNVDACDILLLNRGSNKLEFAEGRGFRTKGIEATRLQLGRGHPGLAALEQRLVTEPDLAAHPDRFLRAELLAAEAFASLSCVPLLAKGQVVGVLEVWSRAPLYPDSDWLEYLETLAGQTAIAVSDAWQFSELQRSNQEMRLAYDSTLEGWSAALDLRDKETEGHSQRVTEMTLKLATSMGVSDDEREQIRRGALLHDIGKMGVPDAILFKPAKLTDEEWGVMRQHPSHAYKLLSPIAYLQSALDIPYCHHEKWDGTGYPRQLKRDEIPLSARIFAVVDVWDALCSDRPYRLGWAQAKVLDHIREQAGKHFDPQVVQAFLELW